MGPRVLQVGKRFEKSPRGLEIARSTESTRIEQHANARRGGAAARYFIISTC